MRAKRRTDVIEVPFPPMEAEATVPSPPESLDELNLRRERIVYDGITNLPIHPFETRLQRLSRQSTRKQHRGSAWNDAEFLAAEFPSKAAANLSIRK